MGTENVFLNESQEFVKKVQDFLREAMIEMPASWPDHPKTGRKISVLQAMESLTRLQRELQKQQIESIVGKLEKILTQPSKPGKPELPN